MESRRDGDSSDEMKAATHRGEATRKVSLVIVRQSYTYLEPFVRSMFEDAEDVRIIVDRRFHERRRVTAARVPNRRTSSERRVSSPMLDIVIAVEG